MRRKCTNAIKNELTVPRPLRRPQLRQLHKGLCGCIGFCICSLYTNFRDDCQKQVPNTSVSISMELLWGLYVQRQVCYYSILIFLLRKVAFPLC